MNTLSTKMSRYMHLLLLAGVLALSVPMISCNSSSDHMEDAGENMEDAAEDVGDAVEETVEDAGDAIEDATN